MIFYQKDRSGHGINLERFNEGFTGIWYAHTPNGENVFFTFGYGEIRDGILKFGLYHSSTKGFPIGPAVDTKQVGWISIVFTNPQNWSEGFTYQAEVDGKFFYPNDSGFSPAPPSIVYDSGEMTRLAG